MSIMSHKDKFFFVHIEKNAGSSITKFLKKNLQDSLHFKDREYDGPFKGMGGITANEYINKFGKDMWEEYFSFCIVRNSWDRIVSWYKYDQSYWLEQYGYRKLSFDSWLELFEENYGLNQLRFFKSESGKNMVDFIGRYENLEEDFSFICNKLNIQNAKLPHINRTKDRNHYSSFYTKKTKDFVFECCREEIEMFNYKF